MKTLKKTLCLILAVVMVVGVLILPAHAADDYTDAITALQNYKVLQGKGDGLIHADDPVTRADMAAIVYRIMTGDTESATATDAKAAAKYGAYADKFKDLTANDQWAKGYIGFCANQGVLKGDEKGNVKPNQQITGYEVQAMLLRALGYDKNNEYTGKDWKFNILADATKTGISKGVSTDPANKTPRGAVAQLTYNAATGAYRVAPAVYPHIGYSSLDHKLIEKVDTTPTGDTTGRKLDTWGAPSYVQYFRFTWPDTYVYGSYTKTEVALYDSYVAATECDVAEALKITTSAAIVAYTNGKGNVDVTTPLTIEATDTVNTVGQQGRHTSIYANPSYISATATPTEDPYITTYVDTFLAVVTDTVDQVKDPAGHEMQAAKATLTVYSNNVANVVTGVTGMTNATQVDSSNAYYGTVTIANTAGYAVGDVVRVQMLTVTARNALGTGMSEKVGTANRVQSVEKISPVTVTVASVNTTGGTSNPDGASITGTNGTTYKYNWTFGYNTTAQTNPGTSVNNRNTTSLKLLSGAVGNTYGLYLDSQNNILGIVPAPTTNFGVVTAVDVVKNGASQYYNQYTIKTATGDVTVNQVNVDGSFWTTSTLAEGANNTSAAGSPANGRVPVNTLVYFQPNVRAAGYSLLTPANFSGTVAQTNTFEAGVTDVLGGTTTTNETSGTPTPTSTINDLTVDNDTVFFVVNYKYTEGLGQYSIKDYSVYTGFTAIPDLKLSAENLNFGGTNNDVDTMKVSAISWDNANGGLYTTATSGTKRHADYVLVEFANLQTTPAEKDNLKGLNYAFLLTGSDLVNVTDDYWTFKAIVNGEAGHTINVARAAGGDQPTQAGLYTYKTYANGGYTVTGPLNVINTDTADAITTNPAGCGVAGTKWTYAAGVLTATEHEIVANTGNKSSSTTTALTVAKDAKVYLVNPTTGACTNLSLSALEAGSPYLGSRLWYQFNTYGWVNVIYVEYSGPVAQPTPVNGEYNITAAPTASADANGTEITLTGGTTTGTAGSNNGANYQNATLEATVTIKRFNEISGQFALYGDGKTTVTSQPTITSGSGTLAMTVTSNLPLIAGTYLLEISVKATAGDSTTGTTTDDTQVTFTVT